MTPATSDAVAEAVASASLMFVENVGQFDEEARFQVRGTEGSLWLAEEALWITVLAPAVHETGEGRGLRSSTEGVDETRQVGANIRLSFVGANPGPQMEPFERLDTTVSYFQGSDPAGWHAAVPVWGGVRYVDLYPDVDLELSEADGQLQPQLVMRATAPSGARLRVEGASLEGIEGGDLLLQSAAGPVAFPLPVAPFELEIEGYDGAGRTVRLHAAPRAAAGWDGPSALEEPGNASALRYSTFLGGTGEESGMGIAVDNAGNAYVTGHTSSYGFPTTPGVFDPTINGVSGDTFVTKLNASGSGLLYSTFLGGHEFDDGAAIAVDGSGAVFVAGRTDSSNFPTTANAFDRTFNGFGYTDSFVAKLNENGSALLYSTFLGGLRSDWLQAIAVDGAGTAYVVGHTDSSDFPTTPGAFDRSYNESPDGFVTRLNGSGSALLYSTFLGGTQGDWPRAIALDGSGNAYLTGTTASSDFPISSLAFDATLGGASDAFVTKLNPVGSALLYSTYLGAAERDSGYAIALDETGSAYIAGGSGSSDFPTTPGAFDTTFNGSLSDGFVTRLNGSGSALLYSTFLGGADWDWAEAIVLDSAGNASIVGTTRSAAFPTTPDAFDTSYNGNGDLFITKLLNTGSALLYSTYLGGSGGDYSYTIALDGEGNGYLTGESFVGDFPTTPGAFDTTFSGGMWDAFVSKVALPDLSALAINHVVGAPGSYFTLTGTDFMPNSTVELWVNGRRLEGVATVASDGTFTIILSTLEAGAGHYVVSARVGRGGTSPAAFFTLDPTAPTHPQEGSGPIFSLPAGIAFMQQSLLPLIHR